MPYEPKIVNHKIGLEDNGIGTNKKTAFKNLEKNKFLKVDFRKWKKENFGGW